MERKCQGVLQAAYAEPAAYRNGSHLSFCCKSLGCVQQGGAELVLPSLMALNEGLCPVIQRFQWEYNLPLKKLSGARRLRGGGHLNLVISRLCEYLPNTWLRECLVSIISNALLLLYDIIRGGG